MNLNSSLYSRNNLGTKVGSPNAISQEPTRDLRVTTVFFDMIAACLVGSEAALLTNTDWKVLLSIGGEAKSSQSIGILPLPLSLRFAGDEITAQVDSILHSPKRLESLASTAKVVTREGEQAVPVQAIGWAEDDEARDKSLVTWCVEFPEGAERGALRLPPGRVYCSAQLWQAADLDTKRRALARLQQSMTSLEQALSEWRDGEGLRGLLDQFAERRRLDERIVALEEQVPDTDTEVVPVPGAAEAVISREGGLSVRREHVGMAERLTSLLGGTSAEFVQIGTFSLRPISPPSMSPPPLRPEPAHAAAVAPRARASRMGLFDSLPGFWKSEVPDGYARASHILFLGTDEATEARADSALEGIRNGRYTFTQAARQFSSCPTRDQEPAGDLGTFASLSAMAKVDEMRSFDGVMELPYEGQNTRSFDDAVFSAPLGEPVKVRSQWGYHLVLVSERGGGERAVIAPESPASFDAQGAQVVKDDAGRSL